MKTALRTALLLAAVAPGVHAQGRGAPAPALTLQLRFDREEVVLGEPVVAYLTVKNTGSAARTIPSDLRPEYGACRFDIATEGQQPRPFLPWIAKDSDAVQSLPPGGEKSAVIKLFYGANGWTFKTAGVYTVATRCLGAVAPEATIRVTTSESASDKAAAEMVLSEPQAGLFLMVDGADNLTKGLAVLQKVGAIGVTQRASVLAAYANASLGLNAGKGFVDLKTGESRQADRAKAVQYLQAGAKALQDRRAILFASKATTALKEQSLALKNGFEESSVNTTPATWSAATAGLPKSVLDAIASESAIEK